MKVRRIALIGLLALGGGCRGTGSSATAHEREQAGFGAGAVDDEGGPGRPSWGPRVPDAAPAKLLAAELARRVSDPELRARIAPIEAGAEPGASAIRERALWSVARIGGAEAREQLLAELDVADPQAVAAAALLEVPRSEPGSPAEPGLGATTDEVGLGAGADPWATLEDALWTRYAIVNPAATSQQRALLLAIARIGGGRSLARLGVDLAERPGPEHRPEIVARWSTAMRSVGLLCARGLALEQATAAAMAGGLERRAGVDPRVTAASLYALSRCARSSGELLVESRELLVSRLTPHVEAPESSEHAALAWRAFAALGELPAELPEAILGAAPPEWTVEVEAARALGSSSTGAALLRERLIALPDEALVEALGGPRVHVLLAGLQAMRGTIATAEASADAELVALAEPLLAGRRSDDPRRRKAAALALCELRLLQAIRTGETASLLRCDRLPGAAEVGELPPGLLAKLEVEALLRATRSDDDGKISDNLGTAEIDAGAPLPAADQQGQEAQEQGRNSASPDESSRRVRINRLLELARDPVAARATPALHALAEIDDPAVLPVLRAALRDEDPGVLAAAATAVAVRSIDASKRDLDVVPLLEELVLERSGAPDLEARLAAIEALGALARSAVATLDPNGDPATASPGHSKSPAASSEAPESPWLARTVVPLARDAHVAVRTRAREALLGHEELLRAFDRTERDAAASRPSPFLAELTAMLERSLARPALGLRVETSAGTFTIEFAGVSAPINQANLAALAEDGYFDGLSVHRVVPGFVVQGGDPRGDGYGGPGYVVPCEWSNLRYERGTVGIALAGKDTGGSQFFVTQTPQPHLDARYTVVGQVGEGLEVVDRLLPGDRIEAVRVVRAGGGDG